MTSEISVRPFGGPCRAGVLTPGSKSLTNRAMVLAALKPRITTLTGVLLSRDTEIMADCLVKLGYSVNVNAEEKSIKIVGRYGGIPNDYAELNVGNAGTAARFIVALAALRMGGEYVFDSDEAMYRRPMAGLLSALKEQGAEFEFLGAENHFPFRMKTWGLKGGEIKVDAGESSQMLSALLMVAPFADEKSKVALSGETVSRPFVDMTLGIMKDFGFSAEPDGNAYDVAHYDAAARRGDALEKPAQYAIEPDATAASYFAMLPALAGGVCELENFAGCKLQGDVAFVSTLEGIGLVKTERVENNLLVFAADNPVFPEKLELDFNDISDTFLTLAAASALLPFKTTITGIAHTRRQETDRIAAMAAELKKVCAEVSETEDSISITPYTRDELAKKIRGEVSISTYEDHRIAMSFAVLGCADLRGDGSPWIKIENPHCTSKTWKEFFEVLGCAKSSSERMRIVGVDGGAAVGKSSVSKECSRILDYMHVDTGSHYRTLTYGLLEGGISDVDTEAVEKHLEGLEIGTELVGNTARMTVCGALVDDAEIRTERINSKVAQVAAMPAVRAFLKSYQRSMADFAKEKGFAGLIMEGRDIGSVIFPNADVLIFLDADEETRAARRAKEGISDSIKKRDEIDKNRKTAPLVMAERAVRIDTSHMTKGEVVAKTVSLIVESK